MINLEVNKNRVLQDLQNNLGLPNTKEGSYLRTVFDGLYRAAEDVIKSIDTNYNNVNINTADEESLELYGELKGFPRLKSSTITVTENSKDLILELDLYKPNKDLLLDVFKKGETVYTETYDITFLKDISFNTSLKGNPVSCIITTRKGFNLSNINLEENEVLDVEVPAHLKDTVKSVKLRVQNERVFTRDLESISSYRKRLLHLGLMANTSSEDSVNRVISLAPGLRSYYIDKSSLPHTVFCITDGMYSNRLDTVFGKYTYPYLVNSLHHSRAYGQSYNISPASPIPFHINIITSKDELFNEDILIGIANSIANNHYLGSDLRLSATELELHIKKYIDEDFNFSVVFYYDYSSITVKTENPNEIVLKANEYPFILSCRVNSTFKE